MILIEAESEDESRVPKDSLNSPLNDEYDNLYSLRAIDNSKDFIWNRKGSVEKHDESTSTISQKQSFSELTKCIINKDLLSNMHGVGKLMDKIQASMDKLKEYYNLSQLETDFLQLRDTLNSSFNIAFCQIVDLHMQNNPNDKYEEYVTDLSNLKTKYHKIKESYDLKCTQIDEIKQNFNDERENLVNVIDQNSKEIAHLKSLLDKNKDFDPQHIVDNMKSALQSSENEKEEARYYAKQLEKELFNTKQIMHNNKVNLIDPLKQRLFELESMVHEKEQKVRKVYKKKIRKFRKELENEKKINVSLAKRICLIGGDTSSSSIPNLNVNHSRLFLKNYK